MGRLTHELWMFCKAQMSAQVATLVDFVVTLVLKEVFGMWYVTATFLGAISGGTFNCMVNYRWVFDSDGLKKRWVALKYLLVWAGSITLNTLGTYALTELSHQYFLFAKIVVAVLVGVFWNYQMQRLFVFRNNKIFHRKNSN